MVACILKLRLWVVVTIVDFRQIKPLPNRTLLRMYHAGHRIFLTQLHSLILCYLVRPPIYRLWVRHTLSQRGHGTQHVPMRSLVVRFLSISGALLNYFSVTTDVFTLSNPQTSSNFSFLAGSVCPLQNFSGPSNQSFCECYALKAGSR